MENNNKVDNQEKQHRTAQGHRIVKLFSSLTLTITLLILLALISIIGTAIPQNASEAHYLHQYGPSVYPVLQRFGFFDIYHSWWFVSLLILLSINLLTCSAKNLPRTLRIITKTNATLDRDRIKTLPFTATLSKKHPVDEMRRRLIPIMKKHCGTPAETQDGQALHLFCEKAKYSRLGVYVTHLSVLIILGGGLIGSFLGFRGHVTILEGESVDQVAIIDKNQSFRQLDFQIRCDDFEVTYYPTGMPKDYRSTLTIIDDGTEVLTETIEVNHPLRYKGLAFYQSSYGTASTGGKIVISVKKKDQKGPGETVTVEPGASFPLSDTDLTVKVNRFLNDFVIDSNGNAVNQSSEPNNPAAELFVLRNNELQYRTWVFQKFPNFHGSKGDYAFILQGFQGKEYTGLQVTKDPGELLVWIGCALMIIGIVGTFSTAHRQVWLRITPEKQKVEVVLAGTTNKNRMAFEKEFQRLLQDITKVR